MIDFVTLATFVVVVLGLFAVPGPAVLLVLTRTAQGGRPIGIATGAGIATGDLVHTLLAAIGLSALLMTSSLAFSVVKLCGAGYLLWLGVRALLEKPAAPSTSAAPASAAAAISPARAFWQAVPAELLNPKTALFFLAFMPQFVHADHGHVLAQFLILGLVFAVMSLGWSTMLVFAMRPLGRLVSRMGWLQRWKGKLIGVIFVSLGVRVAFQRQ
ncbi:LysE family translocator [Scleromatobacter humisilvae]|uniref:LysE family translocator n=1 Tax=Scleromatobacter humisilvae TaxID=2897159 RepID=A0A9X1YIZ7_9BURK|nr:LysE family translocator [Scleromatobacter humisilvae]MCK9687194.1 LysE family translocator [Scleromatobacter humisilvae]